MKELMDTMDKCFQERLLEKRNWTREEVSKIYTEVKEKVFLEYLDKFVGK